MFLPIVKNDSFFSAIKIGLGKKISEEQKNSVSLILSEVDFYGVKDKDQVAYILATCWHECRFRSIREFRALPNTRIWSWQNRYWESGYYGRGYCQITWKKNYEKFSPVVNADLVSEPDLALDPKIAAKILVYGMVNGSFVGDSLVSEFNLSTYFPESKLFCDWFNARKIINGTFQAEKVAISAKIIAKIIDDFLI